jgi:predicted esterase
MDGERLFLISVLLWQLHTPCVALNLMARSKHTIVTDSQKCGVVWMHGVIKSDQPDLHGFEEWIPKMVSNVTNRCSYRFPMAQKEIDPYMVNNTEQPWGPWWHLDVAGIRIPLPWYFKGLQTVFKNEPGSMHHWFNFSTFGACYNEDNEKVKTFESIQSNVHVIHENIDALVAEGVPAENIFVGGYSQGGAMALLSGVQYPKTLAGIMAYLPQVIPPKEQPDAPYKDLVHPANKDVDVIVVSSPSDAFIPQCMIEPGVKGLRNSGLHVVHKEVDSNLDGTEVHLIKKPTPDASQFFQTFVKEHLKQS